jgi:acyl carrier protein
MIISELKKIISIQFGVPEDEITLDTAIDHDLNADSFDIVEVVMNIEKTFKIAIQQDEYQGKNTVGSLLELIAIKQSAKNVVG